MKNEKWFALDVSEIEKKLNTNAASGLSLKAARSRYNRVNGSLFTPKRLSPWRIIGSLLSDFALIILLLASIIAIFFDNFYSVVAILIVSFLNLIISFVICYRSQRTLESLESFFRPTARVIRGGKLYNMDYRYVVKGDVLLLERGDIVCADVRLVTSDSLSVSMRINKTDYTYLEKFAKGNIRENENDVTKYINIIHAGSIIESGKARGIVTETGRYTYLGAMTGGIQEINRDKMPTELKRLKKFCSQISFISLLAVLPFCIISFFLSQTQGANVTLSTAFLTALAISASALSQFATTICKVFFISNIKKLVFAKDPIAIRSADALERFSKADYLFVLDGSPFSDGELAFYGGMTFESEFNSKTAQSVSSSSLSDLVGIYTIANKLSLSAGISEELEYEKGIREFCDLAKIDLEALSIRYRNISHYPMVMNNVSDSVKYSESGNDQIICISYTPLILDECREVFIGKTVRPLQQDGISRLKRYWDNYTENAKKVMIITVLDIKNNIRRFAGMIAFGISIDHKITNKIASLTNLGLKTIVFSSKHELKLPEFPDDLKKFPSVSIDYLKENKIPLTTNFGKYMYYQNATEQDIAKLVDYAHSQKKRVAILGFSDYAAKAIEKADVFISSSSIQPRISGALYEEIESLSTTGGKADASCIQMVKNEADILTPRPKKEHGGLSSLIAARKAGICAYRNLKQFVRYVICAQFIRLCTVAVPMLFGNISLDARHILFCSFIIDLIAFGLFLINREPYSNQEETSEWWDGKIKNHLSEDKMLFISALVASVLLILLPRLIGLFDSNGTYLYEEGCAFSGLVYLHLTLLFILRFGKPNNLNKILKNIPFLTSVVGILVILLLNFCIKPIRPIFGLEMGNPFPYFYVSFVPSIIFVLLYYFCRGKKM